MFGKEVALPSLFCELTPGVTLPVLRFARPWYTWCLRVLLQFGLCTFLIVSLLPVFSRSQSSGAPQDATTKTTDAPLLRRFEQRYRNAGRFQATFLERYTENGRLVRVEAGKVYFLQPGKMRWEYELPEKNLFLVDGKTAWFYVPADHTVTRLPAKRSTDWRTPLALLAGKMKLDKVCARVGLAMDLMPDNAEDAMLYCVPRGAGAKDERRPTAKDKRPAESTEPHQNLPDNAAFLEISKATGDLIRVLVHERGDVQLEFRFTNWKFNPPLPEALFRFALPMGVAVVDGQLPAGNSVMR